MLREIVLLSNSGNFSVRIFKLLVLLRLLLPGFLRVLEGEPLYGDHQINYFVYFAMVGLQLFISYVNLLFVLIGIIDYKRKLFFMRIMTSIISPAKDKDFVYSSFLPTMNILCYFNMRSWMELRTCLLDLGRRYTARINLFSSCFMAIYSVFAASLLLIFFGFVKVELTNRFWAVAIFELALVCGILLKMLSLATEVNEQHMVHKTTLLKHRNILNGLKMNLG